MASSFKTQCPHCQAQFNVGDSQLRQAHGAVRCGRCMQVFQAAEHRLETPAAPPPWADMVLDDAPPAPPPRTDAPASGTLSLELDLSDSFLSLDAPEQDLLSGEDFSTMQGAGRQTHSDTTDESWAEALLKELDDDQPEAPPTPPTAPARPESPPPPDLPLMPAAVDFDLFDTDFDNPPATAEAPLFAKPPMDWAGPLKWGLLALLMLLLLGGQYLYFQSDRLAQTSTLRPLYQATCDLLGCTLPQRTDIARIRGANLVVRTHPTVPDALVVDAILFNHADYRQPFPVIELSFSSVRGTPVASRRFTPEEYLHGDLEGLAEMPRDVPIRVSLELRNPGDRAENYRMRFFPAPAPRS